MISKRVDILILNLRQADDINYCHYIQDIIIDNLLTTDDVKHVLFERNATDLSISFDVKIGKISDVTLTLCREFITLLLEVNDKLLVEIKEKEDISSHIVISNIHSQMAI